VPITITLPGPATDFGPGFSVDLQSDFIGPLPEGTEWFIGVSRDEEDAEPIWQEGFATSSVHSLLQLAMPGHSTPIPRMWTAADGDTVFVTAQLVELPFTILDSGQVTATWRPTQQVYTQVAAVQTGAGAGLTSDQAAQLGRVDAATSISIPQIGAPGGSVLTSIASFFTQLPLQFTNRHGSILVSGVGSLARGSEPYRVDAQGIEWHWHTIPPNWGRRLGSVDEYSGRVAQWRLIDQDSSGQLYQLDVVDTSIEGVRHSWGIHNPVTLEWTISPGWVVELSFLVPLLG